MSPLEALAYVVVVLTISVLVILIVAGIVVEVLEWRRLRALVRGMAAVDAAHERAQYSAEQLVAGEIRASNIVLSGTVAVEHIAGPMVDLVQRCRRCDQILIDRRDAMTVEVLDAGYAPPSRWIEGPVYELHHGLATQWSTTPISDDVVPCRVEERDPR